MTHDSRFLRERLTDEVLWDLFGLDEIERTRTPERCAEIVRVARAKLVAALTPADPCACQLYETCDRCRGTARDPSLALTPAPSPAKMPDRPDHVGQFWGCCWVGVQHAISPKLLSWRCVECRCTAFNRHAQGCSHAGHSQSAVAPVAPETPTPSLIDVEQMRANLHATFNGGWHDDPGRRAFHHGMDTVCNVLAAYQKGERTNGILPAHQPPTPPPGTCRTCRFWNRHHAWAGNPLQFGHCVAGVNQHHKKYPAGPGTTDHDFGCTLHEPIPAATPAPVGEDTPAGERR